jgi:hypothetical protein
MEHITDTRNRHTDHGSHTASRSMVDFLVENGIGTIIIGKNPLWKVCSPRWLKEEMDLSESIYVCENPACSLVIDRDVNAALNLAALAKPTRQPGPYREFLGKGETPVERRLWQICRKMDQ